MELLHIIPAMAGNCYNWGKPEQAPH